MTRGWHGVLPVECDQCRAVSRTRLAREASAQAGPGLAEDRQPWLAAWTGLCPDSGSDTRGTHTGGGRHRQQHEDRISKPFWASGPILCTHCHCPPLLSILKWCREEKNADGNFYVCCSLQYCQRDLTPSVTWHRVLGQARQTRLGTEWVWDEGNRAGQNWSKENWRNHQDHENLLFHPYGCAGIS